jgi:hypothetical protein
MPLVVCQHWREYERGWGSRPDGFSLHRTMADRDAFIERHNKALPKDHVPDEYTRNEGEPRPLDVPASVSRKIKGIGTWFTGTPDKLIGKKK